MGFESWKRDVSWWRLDVFCYWLLYIFMETSSDVSASCCLLSKCRNPRHWMSHGIGHLIQWSCCHLYTGTLLLQTANLCCSSLQDSRILYILPWMNLNKEWINLKVTSGGWFHTLKWASHNFGVLCVLVINFDGETEVAVLCSPQGAQLISVCCLQD